MLKLKMMLCVMMLPLVVVGCTFARVCQCVKPPPPPAWIMQPPPDWQTPLNGLFHPRRADHYAKTTGRNPEGYINEQAEEPSTSWQPCNYCGAIHTRFQRSINTSE